MYTEKDLNRRNLVRAEFKTKALLLRFPECYIISLMCLWGICSITINEILKK